MTKYYGSLVGAVKQLSPMRPVDMAFENSKDQILVRDTIELAAVAAGSTVQLAVLGWEDVLDPFACTFACDDLGTGGTISIGDVTYPTALANAVNTDSAALGPTQMMSNVDIANYFKPLWQILGYATLAAAQLIGSKCEVLLTRNTAAVTGTCTVTWQMKGQSRI